MTTIVSYIILFTTMGVVFLLMALVVGKLLRPRRPNPVKQDIYECGEETVGTSWVQFNLRFYVVALLFVLFEVEVALFFPWASVFGKAVRLGSSEISAGQRELMSNRLHGPAAVDAEAEGELTDQPAASPEARPPVTEEAGRKLARVALIDILIFFGVLLVGFAYVWRRGDLDWVRTAS